MAWGLWAAPLRCSLYIAMTRTYSVSNLPQVIVILRVHFFKVRSARFQKQDALVSARIIKKFLSSSDKGSGGVLASADRGDLAER